MSSSRTAQQKLAELEKTAAPFQDQLGEASTFIGLELSNLESLESLENSALNSFYGKEEWVLRWLLKRLQGSEGTSVRLNALSWRLLHHVIRIIPIPNVARLLNERKFLTILSQTLEDAKQSKISSEHQSEGEPFDSSAETSSAKKSRKRKRSGEYVTEASGSSAQELRKAIVGTISYLASPTETLKTFTLDASRSSLASAELMKSVLRTTTDEAARILGSWLSLCQNYPSAGDESSFLDPFIQLWECRKFETDAGSDFSLHCTKPLLSLLSTLNPRLTELNRVWRPQLDRLLSRNVIIPAKASPAARAKLIDTHVAADPALAPIILEISIRFVQTQGTHLEWLPELFTALKIAMSTPKDHASSSTSDNIIMSSSKHRASYRCLALNKMIRTAIGYHVKIETAVLRSIIIEYAFQHESVIQWDLVASSLILDSNVFLASPELLKQLLSQITLAAFLKDWDNVADVVINEVAVPLMNEFAKARELSEFVKHWYAQMKEFVLKCKDSGGENTVSRFCAWEDEAIRQAFRGVITSLTKDQHLQLIDWLETQFETDDLGAVPAACVLLHAIADSIGEAKETVVALQLRFSEMLQIENVSNILADPDNQRYSWRKWCILASVLDTADEPVTCATAIWSDWSKELKRCIKRTDSLEVMDSYHAFQCVFALWNAINRGIVQEEETMTSIENMAIKILERMDKHLATFAAKLENKSDPIHAEPSYTKSSTLLIRGSGWYASAHVACILVKYPIVVELVPKLKSSRQQILHKILRIASMPALELSTSWFENSDCNQFPHLWTAGIKGAIQDHFVWRRNIVMPQLIDAMLQCTTMENSPNSPLPDCNIFVAESLSAILAMGSYGLFTDNQRDLVMKAWAPNTVLRGYLEPVIWALKCNMMKKHTSYEGWKFQTLVDMVQTLPHYDLQNQHATRISTLVPWFGELVMRSINHILSTRDTADSKSYQAEVVAFLKEQTKHRTSFINRASVDKPICDHIGVKLIDTLLQAFKGKLQDQDLMSDKLVKKVHAWLTAVLISDVNIVLDLEQTGLYRHKDDHKLFLSCALDTLEHLDITEDDLSPILDRVLECLVPFHQGEESRIHEDSIWRLTAFIFVHAPLASERLPSITENVDTAVARAALNQIIGARASRLDSSPRVQMAHDLAQSLTDEPDEKRRFARLKALEHATAACEGFKKDDTSGFSSLPIVYSMLIERISKATNYRELRLASHILTSVLGTKRCPMVQQNIDGILCAITTVCSRDGPSISPNHAGVVFSNMCSLLQALLSKRDHWRKLQGHYHALLQPMQALMRCLFTRLASTRATQASALPPWIPSRASKDHNSFPQPRHAAQYARLITLICDPASSVVADSKVSKESELNDKKREAKKNAGEHMVYLLTHYIKLQSEMRLAPDIREKLKEAIWTLMSCTDVDARGRTVLELDDKDRPIWNQLYKDWDRHGKYKGN